MLKFRSVENVCVNQNVRQFLSMIYALLDLFELYIELVYSWGL